MSFNLEIRELDGALESREYELRVRAKDVAFFVCVHKRTHFSSLRLTFSLITARRSKRRRCNGGRNAVSGSATATKLRTCTRKFEKPTKYSNYRFSTRVRMDLETENRIAAILMKEAAELRRQAEKEGVHAYLRQPQTRFRPNSRFLSATVLGVQQANRAVEVNEMWRLRQKEVELDNRLKGKMKDESRNGRSRRDSNCPKSSNKGLDVTDDNASPTCSSRKREYESCHSREENGLRDEELEEFLHSRVKHGRGAVGSRMDEVGPYLPRGSDSKDELALSPNVQERRVYGPEKPSRKLYDSSEEELVYDRKKSKKVKAGSSKKHKSKDKSKEKKNKRKEERSKYLT